LLLLFFTYCHFFAQIKVILEKHCVSLRKMSHSIDSSKGTIDLLNVDYEDVLHLYRGWRNAEGQLKDKNTEMTHLKGRIKQMQDSHVKFRGQIQALESVKELSINLRMQVNSLEEENKKLVVENAKLGAVNNQAEEILIEEEASIKILADKLQATELEAAESKGRIEQLVFNKSELESLASEEQSARLSAEARIRSMDALIDSLTTENKEYKYKLDVSSQKVEQCDKEIAMAASQLASLSEEVANIQQMRDIVRNAEAEKEVMQTDVRRLLRLLENYPAAKGFLKQWQDSEGMSFVDSAEPDFIRKQKGKHGNQASGRGQQQQYDPEHLSQSDFLHLQHVYDVDADTTPMLSSMEEEMGHWVPQESILEGYQFLTSRLPSTPAEVIQKFLRRMNKIWLRREKRRVARVKDKYASTIADLKRQLAMSKPYHGVMAERKIRCLSGQVRTIQEKKLKGRPKLWNEYEEEDNCLELDDDQSQDESKSSQQGRGRGGREEGKGRGRRASSAGRMGGREWNSHHIHEASLGHPQSQSQGGGREREREREKGRGHQHAARGSSPCTREHCSSRHQVCEEASPSTAHPTTASRALQQLNSISTKELLGASLNSLENINRQVKINHLCSQDISGGGGGGALQSSHFEYPTRDYLEGALWLGRNMLMSTEELVGEIDNFRSQYMRDVSQLSKEVGRSDVSGQAMSSFTDRFALLAVSGITEAMSIVYQNRQKSRNLLQVGATL
jgi:hypothetical protein